MDRRTLIQTLAAGSAGLAVTRRLDASFTEEASHPATVPTTDYAPRPFAFDSGLPGLSKDLLAEHLALYKGYISRTSALLKEVQSAEREGRSPAPIQEFRRRLGFEFSGLRLHELYFEALSAKGGQLDENHALQRAITTTWGSFDIWWNALKATCTMPGIGWGALVKDPLTGRLMNAWFQDHENGIPVGTVPILVVDVWEHAYVKDYGASGRAKYVDALRPLINWEVAGKRF